MCMGVCFYVTAQPATDCQTHRNVPPIFLPYVMKQIHRLLDYRQIFYAHLIMPTHVGPSTFYAT